MQSNQQQQQQFLHWLVVSPEEQSILNALQDGSIFEQFDTSVTYLNPVPTTPVPTTPISTTQASASHVEKEMAKNHGDRSPGGPDNDMIGF